jgi:stearoyl-CoA desaturase (delta-9 desaturase)
MKDYSVSEWRYSLNPTTFFIDLMALFGLAYGRKSIPKETVERRIERTGPEAKTKHIYEKEY